MKSVLIGAAIGAIFGTLVAAGLFCLFILLRPANMLQPEGWIMVSVFLGYPSALIGAIAGGTRSILQELRCAPTDFVMAGTEPRAVHSNQGIGIPQSAPLAMTTRRRLPVFGLLVGLLVLSGGVWLLWPRTAITRENAAKIQVGMTRAEVEAILGGPARDESTGPSKLDVSVFEPDEKFVILRESLRLEIIRDRPPSRGKQWLSDSVVVWAREGQEDQNWRIIEVEYVPVKRIEESVLDMLRRRLGL